MSVALTIRDESTDGRTTGETVVEFLTERITVEELIRARVYQEVQDHNRQRSKPFRGLVQPAQGAAAKSAQPVDWKAQVEVARQAFERQQVLILVDNRQVERLNETIDLRPAMPGVEATSVTFLKLTPLVGG